MTTPNHKEAGRLQIVEESCILEALGIKHQRGKYHVELMWWSFQDLVNEAARCKRNWDELAAFLGEHTGNDTLPGERDPNKYLDEAHRALWAMGELALHLIHHELPDHAEVGLAEAIKHFQSEAFGQLARFVYQVGPEKAKKSMMWFCSQEGE